jgi:hypothetical protein
LLAIKDTLGRGDILLQRGQRLLYKGDVVPVLDQNVVDRFPARAVDEGTVHQHDVLDRGGQQFQLVGISEVPHGHSKHNQIGSLEASRKTLNAPPNR